MKLSSVIQDLVDKVAGPNLDKDSIAHLIYYLELPLEEIPLWLASAIASSLPPPPLRLVFPDKVAFGVVNAGIPVYDLEQREGLQRKACRNMERTRIHLLKMETDDVVIDWFETRIADYSIAANAAFDLSNYRHELSPAELSVLVEQIIAAASFQPMLMASLLETLAAQLKREEKRCLEKRFKTTVFEGMKNEGWDQENSQGDILMLEGPIQFKRAWREDLSFHQAAAKLLETLSTFCECP